MMSDAQWVKSDSKHERNRLQRISAGISEDWQRHMPDIYHFILGPLAPFQTVRRTRSAALFPMYSQGPASFYSQCPSIDAVCALAACERRGVSSGQEVGCWSCTGPAHQSCGTMDRPYAGLTSSLAGRKWVIQVARRLANLLPHRRQSVVRQVSNNAERCLCVVAARALNEKQASGDRG